jgi:hypothetical protein
MFEVKKDKGVRRKRYSNPALEFCRWLLRGYEKGHISLIDVDVKLKGIKQTYEVLKRNYFRECLRIVESNVEKRKAKVNTRINSLICLAKIGKGVISQIENEAHRNGCDLNYSRINVGLGTWRKLGIVDGNKKGEFFVAEPFKEIVKRELKCK